MKMVLLSVKKCALRPVDSKSSILLQRNLSKGLACSMGWYENVGQALQSGDPSLLHVKVRIVCIVLLGYCLTKMSQRWNKRMKSFV